MKQQNDCLDSALDIKNFQDFITWKEGAERSFPDARLVCETRIAKAYASIRPTILVPSCFPRVHRCDLVRQWCAVRQFPETMKQPVLACEGVRHGLSLVFKLLAETGCALALPEDVYPVYWRIASEAGLDVVPFPTFPELDLNAIFEILKNKSETKILLLPCPLKLHGRQLTESEVSKIESWVNEDSSRRVILDGVYNFGLPIDALILRLVTTDQVIYLDSLSKGWLYEKTFGVAIVPAQDRTFYVPLFQSECPSQQNLFFAQTLLSRFGEFPIRLAEANRTKRNDLLSGPIGALNCSYLPADRGYLVAINLNAAVLLERHSLIAIPLTVFGAHLPDWSIASVLPVVNSI